jgi:hypothetical protein
MMSRLGVGFIGGTRGDRPWLVRSDYDFAVDTGAQAAYTVFTVTGEVLIHAVFGICEDAFTGAGALIELGVSGNTAVFVAQTTAADLIANEIWHDATPTATVENIDITGLSFVVANGQDIDLLISGGNVTAGKVNLYCIWSPLSATGNVVAA